MARRPRWFPRDGVAIAGVYVLAWMALLAVLATLAFR